MDSVPFDRVSDVSLLCLKHFEGRFAVSSEVRFLFSTGAFAVMKEGTGTSCFAALEVIQVGLYFLSANLESAGKMSLLSSSKSNKPSAKVIGFLFLSDAYAKTAC